MGAECIPACCRIFILLLIFLLLHLHTYKFWEQRRPLWASGVGVWAECTVNCGSCADNVLLFCSMVPLQYSCLYGCIMNEVLTHDISTVQLTHREPAARDEVGSVRTKLCLLLIKQRKSWCSVVGIIQEKNPSWSSSSPYPSRFYSSLKTLITQ